MWNTAPIRRSPLHRHRWVALQVVSLLGVASALLGCDELPPIDENVCGNRLIEPENGEDCDGVARAELGPGTQCGAPGTASACRYQWAEGGARCPTGWGQGADGICRRASSTFEPATGSPWSLINWKIGVGSVDDDAYVDLIGRSGASFTVRYGTEGFDFGAEATMAAGTLEGMPSFADVNGDGLLDLVEPQLEGISTMLGQHAHELEPVIYPVRNGLAPFTLRPTGLTRVDDGGVRSAMQGSWFVEFGPSGMSITTNLWFLHGPAVAIPEPCGPVISGAQSGSTLRVPTADLDGDGVEEAFALACPGASRVWIYEAQWDLQGSTGDNLLEWLDSLRPVLVQELPLPAGYAIDTPAGGADATTALFADEGRTGRPDLFLRAVRSPGTQGEERGVLVADALAPPLPGLAPIQQAFSSMFDRSQYPADGRVAWPLALGHLDSGDALDFIGPDAVYVRATADAAPTSVGGAVFPWDLGGIADLNGDGALDVVVASSDDVGLTRMLWSETEGYNLATIATDGLPIALRFGDFDGDFVEDVAMIEEAVDGSGDLSVSVAHGTMSGDVPAAQRMGRIGAPLSFEPARIASFYTTDATDDLVVVARPPDAGEGSTFWLSFFYGGAGRMLAPLPLGLRSDEQTGTLSFPFLAAAGAAGDGQSHNLLALALEVPMTDEDETMATVSATWFPTNAIGQVILGEAAYDLDLGGTINLAEIGKDGTGPWCAVSTTGALDGSGQEALVLVDRAYGCCVASPCDGEPSLTLLDRPAGAVGDLGATPATDLTFAPMPLSGDLRLPMSVLVHDVDEDGLGDVVVSFGGDVVLQDEGVIDEGDGLARFSHAGVAIYWNDGGRIDHEHPSVVDAWPLGPDAAAVPLVYPMATAAIDVNSDGVMELAVATTIGVYFVAAPSREPVLEASWLTFPRSIPSCTGLFSVDMDRDGLGDLLVGTPDEVLGYRSVPLPAGLAAPPLP